MTTQPRMQDLHELRAAWEASAERFWATVRDCQQGRASQQDVRLAAETAGGAQDRYRAIHERVFGRGDVRARPGDLIDRLALRAATPEVTNAHMVWNYVETLRGEMNEAFKALGAALGDGLPGRGKTLASALDAVQTAHDRWRTAYDLALHDHPLVGRAEIAGARVGPSSEMRPDDWRDPGVRHVRFEVATGAQKLAAVKPDEREQVLVQAIAKALPQLERDNLPYLFCARSEGTRLTVHV